MTAVGEQIKTILNIGGGDLREFTGKVIRRFANGTLDVEVEIENLGVFVFRCEAAMVFRPVQQESVL